MQNEPLDGMFESWHEFFIWFAKMMGISILMLAGAFAMIWLIWAALGD